MNWSWNTVIEWWIMIGIVALILGLAWDTLKGTIHKHTFVTLLLFCIICLIGGPISLMIVLDLWFKHRG